MLYNVLVTFWTITWGSCDYLGHGPPYARSHVFAGGTLELKWSKMICRSMWRPYIACNLFQSTLAKSYLRRKLIKAKTTIKHYGTTEEMTCPACFLCASWLSDLLDSHIATASLTCTRCLNDMVCTNPVADWLIHSFRYCSPKRIWVDFEQISRCIVPTNLCCGSRWQYFQVWTFKYLSKGTRPRLKAKQRIELNNQCSSTIHNVMHAM